MIKLKCHSIDARPTSIYIYSNHYFSAINFSNSYLLESPFAVFKHKATFVGMFSDKLLKDISDTTIFLLVTFYRPH